jgi:hypothetical protein
MGFDHHGAAAVIRQRPKVLTSQARRTKLWKWH